MQSAQFSCQDPEKSWAQILSAKGSPNWFSITSFLITTQITCVWFVNNFQEHKLRISTQKFRENTFALNVIVFEVLFDGKSKPLQNLLKSCKQLQASDSYIAYSYENSYSISRFLVVEHNTSWHHFFPKLLCMMYELLTINTYFVSRCTTFNCNMLKVLNFSLFKCKIKS